MKEYIAKKIDREMTIEDERWEKVEKVSLEYTWDGYRPIPYETKAAMVHSDAGITVLLSSTEWPLRITQMAHDTRVCEDSCLEFFFTPNTAEQKYINFEMNPAGAVHSHIGEGRGKREAFDIVGTGVRIYTQILPLEGWRAFLFVPYSLIDKLYDKRENVFKANFYKCGDSTVKPHYATWNPVGTEKPDYHQPAYFGKIILSEDLI